MGEANTNKQGLNHVVVIAFPYGTHAIPLLNLACRLAIDAPLTNFSFFSTSKSNLTTFGQKPISDIILKSKNSPFNLPSNVKVYDVDDGVPEGFTGHPMAEIGFFLKSMDKNYRKAIDSVMMGHDERKITSIISDSFMWFAGEMAEEMGIPWTALWIGGACSLSTHFYTQLIREKIKLGENGIAGREEELIDFIPGVCNIRIKDLQEGIIFGNLESDISILLLHMGHKLEKAAAVILNSFEEIDLPVLNDLRKKFQKCLTLGPFTLNLAPKSNNNDVHGCLPWLDTQKPASVAYISFGTVTTPPPNELAALAEGLEELGAPFIWSLKDHNKVHLPNGFLEKTKGKGLVVPWAPQEQILKHTATGVFVTHCGWNSIMESVSSGIPMVTRPFFGDQRINSRLVSDVWRIGNKVENDVFTKESTRKSLDMILFSEEGKKMMEKVGSLRGLARHAVSTKGSSTKNFKTLLEIVDGKM